MEKVVFVVLHYITIDMTIECIHSIRDNIKYANYEIVIVDNCSPNNSFELLKKEFSFEYKIHLIRTATNLGFANGNNFGYIYAKEKLNAEFIVVLNNDVIIKQNNFVDQLLSLFRLKKYHILGPDIINRAEIHQSPIRTSILSYSKVKSLICHQKIMYFYLSIKKYFRLDRIQILEKLYIYRNKKKLSYICTDLEQEQIVLQGSCYIFSPIFISHNDTSFCSETFMFGEEDILAYVNDQRNYKILYSPTLQVYHMEQVTRNSINIKQIEKDIFFYKHNIDSLYVLKRLMKKNRK